MNTALVAILKQFRQQLTAIEEELYALQQERGYRVLVEHAADVLMRLQADGTLWYVSPATRTVLGCEPATLVGQTLPEVTWADDRPAVEAALARAVAGEAVEEEACLQAPGAEPVRVHLKLGVLAQGEHGPELYAAARALAEAGAEPEGVALERFVQLALDVHCLIGTDGYLRDANPRFYDGLGATQEELQAAPLLTWVHPDDRDETQHAFDRLAAGNTVPPYRNRYRRADGSYHWFEWAARPAEEGLIYASARDITNQVYAELALEAATERHQQILEQTAEAFLVLDAGWRLTYLNPPAAAVLGRPQTDLLGQVFWEACPAMAESVFFEELHRARDEERLITFEAYYRPTETWLTARVLPSEPGVSVYLLDVTERKQAETTLERYARSLEATKAELEATSAELKQALADREAVGSAAYVPEQVLGLLSQEIRAPMNSIIGLTSILLDSGLDDNQYHCAETIRLSTELLLSVVNDILDYSQIEAGQVQIEARPFQVRDCIEDAMDVVALPATRKRLELSSRLDPNVPETVVGDETRLKQILISLLANAVKFTDEGEVGITVRFETESDGSYLYVSVRDTGIGIPVERQAHLFEPFRQADASVTAVYGGSGLGLSICHRLCEMMGGRIGLESEPGSGSTFHFSIRVEPVDEVSAPEADAGTLLAGRRLLVVDDHETSRWVIEEQARAWGMQVQTCSTPEEAVHVLASTNAFDDPFDVAVVDDVEGVDGAYLLDRMQKLRPGLPVIYSGMGADPGAEGDDRVVGWLPKPLKQKTLRHVLMAALYPEVVTADQAAPGMNPQPVRPLRILLADHDLASQKIERAMLQRLGHRVDIAESETQLRFELERGAFDVVLLAPDLPELDEAGFVERLRQVTDQVPALIAMGTDLAEPMAPDLEFDAVISKPVKLDELDRVLGDWARRTAAATIPDASPAPAVGPEPSTFAAAAEDEVAQAEISEDRPDIPVDPASKARSAAQAFDAEVLQWTSLSPEDPIFDFMLDIMENCLRTARDLLRHIQGYVSDEDRGILESSIHALKSNCQILDVETLVTLSEQVEAACEAGDIETLGQAIRQLVWALEEFQHTVYGHITAAKEDEPVHDDDPIGKVTAAPEA